MLNVVKFIMALLLMVSATATWAAEDTEGTDFWLAMPPNLDSSGTRQIFLTSNINASVDVTVGNAAPVNYPVSANTVVTVDLAIADVLSKSTGVQADKAIHITSDVEITVYALSNRSASTDAYLAIPTDVLGTEYITSHYQISFGANDISVVANTDGTNITIDTPQGANVMASLNAGDVYMLRDTANDLTGSVVSSDKPVGVISSNECTNIPNNSVACDFIAEMPMPTQSWGTTFATVPLKNRVTDTFRVIGAEDGTSVTVREDGQSDVNFMIGRGEFHEFRLTNVAEVLTTKPVMLMQYSNGTSFDNQLGDPFMMMIPPREQFLTEYVFTTPATGFNDNYINLIATAANKGSIEFDGVLVNEGLFQQIGSTNFYGAQLDIALGAHTVTSPSPVGTFVYGFNSADSYGYPAGGSISAIATIDSIVMSINTPLASYRIGVDQACFDFVVTDSASQPVSGAKVDLSVSGANPFVDAFVVTNVDGEGTICYDGNTTGVDTVYGFIGVLNSNMETVTWVDSNSTPPPPAPAVEVPLSEGAKTVLALLFVLAAFIALRRRFAPATRV